MVESILIIGVLLTGAVDAAISLIELLLPLLIIGVLFAGANDDDVIVCEDFFLDFNSNISISKKRSTKLSFYKAYIFNTILNLLLNYYLWSNRPSKKNIAGFLSKFKKSSPREL